MLTPPDNLKEIACSTRVDTNFDYANVYNDLDKSYRDTPYTQQVPASILGEVRDQKSWGHDYRPDDPYYHFPTSSYKPNGGLTPWYEVSPAVDYPEVFTPNGAAAGSSLPVYTPPGTPPTASYGSSPVSTSPPTIAPAPAGATPIKPSGNDNDNGQSAEGETSNPDGTRDGDDSVEEIGLAVGTQNPPSKLPDDVPLGSDRVELSGATIKIRILTPLVDLTRGGYSWLRIPTYIDDFDIGKIDALNPEDRTVTLSEEFGGGTIDLDFLIEFFDQMPGLATVSAEDRADALREAIELAQAAEEFERLVQEKIDERNKRIGTIQRSVRNISDWIGEGETLGETVRRLATADVYDDMLDEFFDMQERLFNVFSILNTEAGGKLSDDEIRARTTSIAEEYFGMSEADLRTIADDIRNPKVMLAGIGSAKARKVLQQLFRNSARSRIAPALLQLTKRVGKSGLTKYLMLRAGSMPAAQAYKQIVAEKHHPIARFLGGVDEQVWARLGGQPGGTHKAIHSLLRASLDKRGLKFLANISQVRARQWLKDHPDRMKDVLNSILESSRQLDIAFGTNVTQKVWLNIILKNFRP